MPKHLMVDDNIEANKIIQNPYNRFITDKERDRWNNLVSSEVVEWENVLNKPNIPTQVSELLNDSNFCTEIQVDTKIETKSNIDHKHSEYATTSSVNNKVDKVSGKGLSTNDFTTAEKNKLAELQNSNITKEYVDTELNKKPDKTTVYTKTEMDAKLSGKANINQLFSKNYNDLTNKPAIPTKTSQLQNDSSLATESYVTNKIAEASLGGGDVDLTGYATKDELNTKSDKTHTHTEYANKSSEHSHSNKTIIDNITNSKINEWDNKSNFNGDYNSLDNKPNIPIVDVNKTYVDNELSKKANYSHIHDEYTTENKVSTMIAEAQLNSGEVDLSGYATKDELNNKVDKVSGKGLSTNDFTNVEKSKLASLQNADVTKAYVDTELDKKTNKIDTYTKKEVDDKIAEAQTDIDLSGYATKDDIKTLDNSKVNKETGKALSSNDFTNGYKTKLDSLENYIHPSKHDASIITQNANNRFVTDAEKTKWNEYENIITQLIARIEQLENPSKPEAPTFCGQMPFKSIEEITYSDLTTLINTVNVTKPQTIYAHSGSTVYMKTVLCAIPKSKGVIAGVIDGAGISIHGAYPISEKVLTIPGIGDVEYSICCNKNAQTYNASTVVKFNIN